MARCRRCCRRGLRASPRRVANLERPWKRPGPACTGCGQIRCTWTRSTRAGGGSRGRGCCRRNGGRRRSGWRRAGAVAGADALDGSSIALIILSDTPAFCSFSKSSGVRSYALFCRWIVFSTSPSDMLACTSAMIESTPLVFADCWFACGAGVVVWGAAKRRSRKQRAAVQDLESASSRLLQQCSELLSEAEEPPSPEPNFIHCPSPPCTVFLDAPLGSISPPTYIPWVGGVEVSGNFAGLPGVAVSEKRLTHITDQGVSPTCNTSNKPTQANTSQKRR